VHSRQVAAALVALLLLLLAGPLMACLMSMMVPLMRIC
jgi:hypothetical protein